MCLYSGRVTRVNVSQMIQYVRLSLSMHEEREGSCFLKTIRQEKTVQEENTGEYEWLTVHFT